MIGKTISHYKVLEKLGQGGMGVVYRAQDTKLDRPVALKFLPAHLLGDEDVRKRFEREAKSAAALSHPNVCRVYEIDEAEGQTFIAMELVEGESLDQRIAQGPLKLQEALEIGEQIAAGLEAAHRKGVVHRDIKPENIMVGEGGHVTIMDFGLARLAEASRLTKTDETVGTVAYMSPEQTEGSGTDERTDIWSLGVVLYEMVTAQAPFKGDYDKAIMYSILNEAPDGSAISYITGDSPAVWLRSLDDERPRKLEGTEGARGVATWSPDSRHLLFSTGNNEFKRIAVAGGQPVPVAEFEGSMGGMSWSPDGETIVIAFGEPPVLYEVSASGGEPRLLFEPLGGQAAANLQPYFLPAEASARALLFDVGTFTERDIYLMNLDTGEPKRIAAGASASYAPSGHILYQTGFREPGVWAVGFSIETLEVTGEPFLVGAGLSRPRISNDNTLVAAELSVGSEPKRLIWRDREGNKLGEIGRPQPVILRPALSPDGRRVAVAGRDEVGYETDIWLHEADRPVAQRLTFDSGIEDFPAWSADGRQVSFSAEGSVLFDIFRRGLDGTQDAEVLVSTPGREAEMGGRPMRAHSFFASPIRRAITTSKRSVPTRERSNRSSRRALTNGRPQSLRMAATSPTAPTNRGSTKSTSVSFRLVPAPDRFLSRADTSRAGVGTGKNSTTWRKTERSWP